MNFAPYLILSLLILSSCASQEPAQIEYGTKAGRLGENKIQTNARSISTEFEDGNQDSESDSGKTDQDGSHYLKFKEQEPKKYVDEDSEKASYPGARKNNPEDLDAELKKMAVGTTAPVDSSATTKAKDSASENASKTTVADKKNLKQDQIRDISQEDGDGPRPQHTISINSGAPKNEQEAEYQNLAAKENDKTSSAANPSSSSTIASGKIHISRPVKGKIQAKYGDIVNGSKLQGVDFAVNLGEPVRACAAGIVIGVGKDEKFGNRIIIKHDNGQIQSAYAHLGKITVTKGQVIRAGEEIGITGQTGDVKTPTLHFALRKEGQSVDPQKFLDN
ncbi:MAG: peptidoglycan DD-metalloendopeptidase family protein [Rickettsiaceae bacterium]|nr:peptidoglycan DD-metalloendopeptidase family protein [Rickettsiaceae bacterium]